LRFPASSRATRDCGFGAFVAARGFSVFVADLGLDFGLAAGFAFAVLFGFDSALALTAASFGFRALAALALAVACLVLARGPDLRLALPLVLVLAAALPRFVLFAMMLASNRLFRAFNPRGVLAIALRTFQAFLVSDRGCHQRSTLLSLSWRRQKGGGAAWFV
jgi:hypothetical protein